MLRGKNKTKTRAPKKMNILPRIFSFQVEIKYKFYAHIKRAKNKNGAYLSDVLVKTIHVWRNEREPAAFPGQKLQKALSKQMALGFRLFIL